MGAERETDGDGGGGRGAPPGGTRTDAGHESGSAKICRLGSAERVPRGAEAGGRFGIWPRVKIGANGSAV